MNQSDIFIFIGPTVSVEIAKQHLKAIYLPPVKYGDVYRITELYQPKIIGIIDGYFNQVPAVWHKEILWAIDRGVSVFGAASMGALRAAELDSLNMRGHGRIYQAYKSGVLPPFLDESFEDDDEVAVIHGPAELGYQQMSEAMINIRITLAKALQQNLISDQELKTLTAISKSLFYPQRGYQKILELAHNHDIDSPKLERLKLWLEENKVDQKQLDAVVMLDAIKQELDLELPVDNSQIPVFQHTSQWQTAINEIDESHYIENPVINEIRLIGDEYFDLLHQALSSTLISQTNTPETASSLNQLHRCPDELNKVFAQRWQIRQGQTTADQLSSFQLDQILLSYLRHHQQLSVFEQRAKDKKSRLSHQIHRPKIDSLNELDLLQLTDWYFTHQLNTELPDQIETYAQQLGFAEADDFYAMILDEYYYLKADHEGG